MAASRGVKVAAGAAAIGLVAALALARLANRGPSLAPDFVATDLKGQRVRLSALRGKVVLVNLWATWCPPCLQEMPSMERLYTRLKGHDFEVLAVSQDEDASLVAPLVQKLAVSFPVLVDPERQVGERFGVWGYPESFVIDRNGYVVERVIGPREWDTPAQVSALEVLLAGSGTATGSRALPSGPS
jgi:peroxiredoxin